MRRLIVLAIFAVALLVLTINPSGYSQLKDAGGKLTRPAGLPPAGPATGQKLPTGKVPPVADARAGKQPTVGLPPWFHALDTDRDGQVSLQEWRDAGKELADFRLYDLDDDGFITPEEVLRPMRKPIALRLKQGQSNYQGTLEATDVRHQGKKLSKVFTIELQGGRTYQFDHMSKAFDAYLYLEDAEGVIVAQNDDGGEGTNSRIVHQAVDDGTYRLIATSLSGNGVGDFSVAVRDMLRSGGTDPQELPTWFNALDTDHDGQVALYEWRKGGKTLSDFRKYDLDGDGFITPEEVFRPNRRPRELRFKKGLARYSGNLESTDVRHKGKKLSKIFTIALKEGRTYQFDHMSKAFDAYLYLEDAEGAVLAKNDDGGEGTNSRIVHEAAEDGIYRLVATSLNGSRLGAFSVEVRVLSGSGQIVPKDLPSWFNALDTDQDGQVSFQEWREARKKVADFRKWDRNGDGVITAEEVMRTMKEGTTLRLEQGEANYDGAIEKGTGEKYLGKKAFKVFTFKVEAGKTYQIEHVSQEFYAYLVFEDSAGAILAKNNGGGKGRPARIVHTAAKTEICRIIATSQDGYKGGYFSMSIRVQNRLGVNVAQYLPAWFRDLDMDHDGQIALYEWRKAGKSLAEFRLYDLDDDGFITPEEMLRHFQNHPDRPKTETDLMK